MCKALLTFFGFILKFVSILTWTAQFIAEGIWIDPIEHSFAPPWRIYSPRGLLFFVHKFLSSHHFLECATIVQSYQLRECCFFH